MLMMEMCRWDVLMEKVSRDKRMEDEGMAIVCLYIENRRKNVRMLARCGLTGPDGMSSRDSPSSWPFSPPVIS